MDTKALLDDIWRHAIDLNKPVIPNHQSTIGIKHRQSLSHMRKRDLQCRCLFARTPLAVVQLFLYQMPCRDVHVGCEQNSKAKIIGVANAGAETIAALKQGENSALRRADKKWLVCSCR